MARALPLIPDSGDVPLAWAAARMGYVDETTGRVLAEAFAADLPALIARGFPGPDPTTGRFDIDAVNAWRRRRHNHLFTTASNPVARDAKSVVRQRLDAMRSG